MSTGIVWDEQGRTRHSPLGSRRGESSYTASADPRRAEPARPCLSSHSGHTRTGAANHFLYGKKGRGRASSPPPQKLPGHRGGTSVCSWVTSGLGDARVARSVWVQAERGCDPRSLRRCSGAAPWMASATRRTTRRGRWPRLLPSTSPQRCRTPSMMVRQGWLAQSHGSLST